ncbi:hypothetical protein [Halobacterium sp. CBA1126]|nr:hypothetical protein [Halobacterium sp. CBA1126]
MAYSPSRGLLYSAPPAPESNRRDETDAEEPDASADATPAAADD